MSNSYHDYGLSNIWFFGYIIAGLLNLIVVNYGVFMTTLVVILFFETIELWIKSKVKIKELEEKKMSEVDRIIEATIRMNTYRKLVEEDRRGKSELALIIAKELEGKE